MPPHTLFIHTRDLDSKVSFHNKKAFITYTLAEQLHFEEPHFARLLWLGGSKEVALVFADFVKRQSVNNELLPYLGSSATGAYYSWIPLASNHIPQTGIITIEHANKSSIAATSNFNIAIEIAPESWINGA